MIKVDTQGFDISSKSVAVIGCGGLGCNVCIHLAGAGVGRIFVCDYDTVSESNLNRQFVYNCNDIGQKKAFAMQRFLEKYAPESKIIAVDQKIESPDDLVFAKECDIIILAVDNVKSSKIANNFCKKEGIPLCAEGISGFYGSCCLYIPGETPCIECAGLLEADRNTANISTTAGIIGSLCTSLAIKYLIGDKSSAGRLFIYDNDEITSLKIKASKECKCMGGRN